METLQAKPSWRHDSTFQKLFLIKRDFLYELLKDLDITIFLASRNLPLGEAAGESEVGNSWAYLNY